MAKRLNRNHFYKWACENHPKIVNDYLGHHEVGKCYACSKEEDKESLSVVSIETSADCPTPTSGAFELCHKCAQEVIFTVLFRQREEYDG